MKKRGSGESRFCGEEQVLRVYRVDIQVVVYNHSKSAYFWPQDFNFETAEF